MGLFDSVKKKAGEIKGDFDRKNRENKEKKDRENAAYSAAYEKAKIRNLQKKASLDARTSVFGTTKKSNLSSGQAFGGFSSSPFGNQPTRKKKKGGNSGFSPNEIATIFG
jgi:hypothetical protein